MKLIPRLDALDAPRLALWNKLGGLPPDFVLFGGAAAALRLGHRIPEGFDFFTASPVDLPWLHVNVPLFMAFPHALVNSDPYRFRYRFFVNTGGEGPVTAEVGLSLANGPSDFPGYFMEPDRSSDNGVAVASPVDLIAYKLYAFMGRPGAEDFIDLAGLARDGAGLQDGFAACAGLLKAAGHGDVRRALETLRRDLAERTFPAVDPTSPLHGTVREAAAKVDVARAAEEAPCLHARNTVPGLGASPVPAGAGPDPARLKKHLENAVFQRYAKGYMWLPPSSPPVEPLFFLAFVMGTVPWLFQPVTVHFGFTAGDFAEALRLCPYGVFKDAGSWERWNRRTGLDPPLPFPEKPELDSLFI